MTSRKTGLANTHRGADSKFSQFLVQNIAKNEISYPENPRDQKIGLPISKICIFSNIIKLIMLKLSNYIINEKIKPLAIARNETSDPENPRVKENWPSCHRNKPISDKIRLIRLKLINYLINEKLHRLVIVINEISDPENPTLKKNRWLRCQKWRISTFLLFFVLFF